MNTKPRNPDLTKKKKKKKKNARMVADENDVKIEIRSTLGCFLMW